VCSSDLPKSYEFLRVWMKGKTQQFILRTDVWEDPAAWGLLLVDLARHAARGYRKASGQEYEEVLARIKAGFDAEWSFPTETMPDVRS
jgi:hypothetical protein